MTSGPCWTSRADAETFKWCSHLMPLVGCLFLGCRWSACRAHPPFTHFNIGRHIVCLRCASLNIWHRDEIWQRGFRRSENISCMLRSHFGCWPRHVRAPVTLKHHQCFTRLVGFTVKRYSSTDWTQCRKLKCAVFRCNYTLYMFLNISLSHLSRFKDLAEVCLYQKWQFVWHISKRCSDFCFLKEIETYPFRQQRITNWRNYPGFSVSAAWSVTCCPLLLCPIDNGCIGCYPLVCLWPFWGVLGAPFMCL